MSGAQPIDMILICPACSRQHIDEPKGEWKNPPHRSHLCLFCLAVWRPADVETNGVKEIKTKGALDNYFFTWPHGGRPAQ